MPRLLSLLDRAKSKLKSAKILIGVYDGKEAGLDDIAGFLALSTKLLIVHNTELRGEPYFIDQDFSGLIKDLEDFGGYVPQLVKENHIVLNDWMTKTAHGQYVISSMTQFDELIPVLEQWCADSEIAEKYNGNLLGPGGADG